VDFDIPAVQKTKLYNFLFTQLDIIVKSVPERLWDQTRWGNLFHAGFKNLFQSLRDVKRYINSLRFNFILIQKENSFELDPIDFVGLEAIRVFAPETYQTMKDKNYLFTATDSQSYRNTAQEETRKKEIESIIEKVEEQIRDAIKNILFQLFPQVDGLFRKMHYTSSFRQEWTKSCRICSTEIFERYFVLEVPEGEIAQFEINRVLNATKDKQVFSNELMKFLGEKRIRKLLEKLEDYTDSFELKYASNIIEPLFDISDMLPDEQVGFLDIGSDMRIMRIIYHYLKRIQDKGERSSVLKEAIKNSKGLHGCIHKISIEIQGIEKKSEYERLILENEVDDFKKLCVDKIKEFQNNNKLRDLVHLAYILYRWREWGNKHDVEKFVNELIKDDKGLIILLKNFLSKRSSHTIGDYVSRTAWKMSYKGLRDFINLDEVKKRLEKVKIHELQGKEKLAVETFLRDFDSRDKNIDFD
jgi:predicted KAP-like P-loop ATPase